MESLTLCVDINGGDRKEGMTPMRKIAKALARHSMEENVNYLLFGEEAEARQLLKQEEVDMRKIGIIHSPAWFFAPNKVEGSDRQGLTQRIRETSLHRLLKHMEETKGTANCAYSMHETASLIGYSRNMMIAETRLIYPPLVAEIPHFKGGSFLFTDVGATLDTPPKDVMAYAMLCDTYSRHVLKIGKPRIAILNIGEERGKGNAFVNQLDTILRDCSGLNYTGFIEGKHGIFEGKADIVLAQGFVGNTSLKTIEGIVEAAAGYARSELCPSTIMKRARTTPRAALDIAGVILLAAGIQFFKMSGTYSRMKDHFSPDNRNAAPLLGLEAYITKGHGNSTENGIYHGLCRTVEYCRSGIVEHIRKRFNTTTQAESVIP